MKNSKTLQNMYKDYKKSRRSLARYFFYNIAATPTHRKIICVILLILALHLLIFKENNINIFLGIVCVILIIIEYYYTYSNRDDDEATIKRDMMENLLSQYGIDGSDTQKIGLLIEQLNDEKRSKVDILRNIAKIISVIISFFMPFIRLPITKIMDGYLSNISIEAIVDYYRYEIFMIGYNLFVIAITLVFLSVCIYMLIKAIIDLSANGYEHFISDLREYVIFKE